MLPGAMPSGTPQEPRSEIPADTIASNALRPSRAEPTQVYIVIELADEDAVPPELIYVCRPGRPCEKHRLPVAHDGAIQILADLHSPLVEALRDGHAEVFLR